MSEDAFYSTKKGTVSHYQPKLIIEWEEISMIIVLKPETTLEEKKKVIGAVEAMGYKVKIVKGETQSILGVIGDTAKLEEASLFLSPQIEKVLRIKVPYKMASRAFQNANSVIRVGNHAIGDGSLVTIAGPCCIESREQLFTIASEVKASGAHILRGGAYKPRTSPYSFQGMGEAGLKLLKEAGCQYDMPVCTELMSSEDFELVEAYTDIIQIGARNMQNFSLLKKLGETQKPVLLKRGMSATIEEFLMSAEYIMASGNPNVILCERGIRTFENYTRNTLDLAVVCAIKELSHLPIMIDPSHATGKWKLIEPISKAAVAVGCDGLMIEVHHEPDKALSDGPQSLKPEKFAKLMDKIQKLHAVCEQTQAVESVAK